MQSSKSQTSGASYPSGSTSTNIEDDLPDLDSPEPDEQPQMPCDDTPSSKFPELLRLFRKKIRKFDKSQYSKSKERAVEMRTKGNDAFGKKNYTEALDMYNEVSQHCVPCGAIRILRHFIMLRQRCSRPTITIHKIMKSYPWHWLIDLQHFST